MEPALRKHLCGGVVIVGKRESVQTPAEKTPSGPSGLKVIAAIEADLEVTPIGTASRLAVELRGCTVLERTVSRLSRARSISAIYVLCPAGQAERISRLLGETGAVVRGHDAGPAPWRALVQPARKWSLDGWRGGIGGTTVFDEYTDCRLLHELLKSTDADAVLSVPPAAPLVEAAIADRMVEHFAKVRDEARMVFTQSPPGVAGILLDRGLVHELAEQRIPVGWLLSYKPDNPRKDLVFLDCRVDVPVELRHATGRLIADTDTAMRRVAELVAERDDSEAASIGRWLSARERAFVSPLPREVEIELTTDDPYPNSLVRPRGSRVPRRGPMDRCIVERISRELSEVDDSLIVFGGFGDPLRHSQFGELLRVVRPKGDRGVFGVAVRTAGVDLTDQHIDALIECGVDVVEVTLDAWTPATYARLHAAGDASVADLNRVLASLDRLTERRERAGVTRPILVPSMTKCKQNVHELDDFFDGWLRRAGATAIHGYSHHARKCEDHAVMRMTPPTRGPCARLWTRCVVLAEGVVTSCDQDFAGRQTVGRLIDQSLCAVWEGSALHDLRVHHRSGSIRELPLCGQCDEWHRP